MDGSNRIKSVKHKPINYKLKETKTILFTCILYN